MLPCPPEKAKMIELTRYLVRMGSKGWMVWGRDLPEHPQGWKEAVRLLTEEQAREIKDELNKNNVADG